jgi:hypothetical protein
VEPIPTRTTLPLQSLEVRRDNLATDSAPEPKAKQAKNTNKSNAEASPSTPEKTKPTLTEKDLEFDFDHSQIRDPRATPGRVKRPRYEERELSEESIKVPHPQVKE